MKTKLSLLLVGALALALSAWAASLLNVSYDPTRELYKEINPGLYQILAEPDRRNADHPAITRRLGRRPAR